MRSVLSSHIHDHIHLLEFGFIVDPVTRCVIPAVDMGILVCDVDGRHAQGVGPCHGLAECRQSGECIDDLIPYVRAAARILVRCAICEPGLY